MTAINNSRKALYVSFIGNFLEYYDFALFGYLAPIIAINFFPKNEPFAMLLTLIIYALGFVTRPVGSIVLGYIGDIYGRRVSLIFSITCMSLSCFFISILPNYAQIGIYSPMLLAILRLLQGFCMSGEYGGAIVFAIEHASTKASKSQAGSIVASSTFLGCFFAAIISALLLYLDNKNNMGWRLAFFIGAIVGLCGIYIRKNTIESHEFRSLKQSDKKMPLRKVLNKQKYLLSGAIGLFAITGINAGIYTTFLNTFLVIKLMMMPYQAILIMSLCAFICFLFSLVPIYLQSKINYIDILRYTILILIIAIWPIMNYVINGNLIIVIIAHSCLAAISGIIWGTVNVIISNLFEASVRLSSVTFSDGLARAFIVGLTPAFANYLLDKYNSLFWLTILIFLLLIYLYKFLCFLNLHDISDKDPLSNHLS